MELPGFGYRPTRFDQLPDDRLIDETKPVVFATIDNQPVALVQPERYGAERARTIPVTMSRLERDYALRRGYEPGPYVPSALWGVEEVRLPSWPAILGISIGAAVVIDFARGAPWTKRLRRALS